MFRIDHRAGAARLLRLRDHVCSASVVLPEDSGP